MTVSFKPIPFLLIIFGWLVREWLGKFGTVRKKNLLSSQKTQCLRA